MTSSDTNSTRSIVIAPSQHSEEAGTEDYQPQVGSYPVQHDHVSTYGADDEEYDRPNIESRLKLEEMKRALVSQHDGSQVLNADCYHYFMTTPRRISHWQLIAT